MGEYPWRVGDFGAKLVSQHCRWRGRVVSAPEIEFCAPPPVGDLVNTTPTGSSTDPSPWTNPGDNNAQSGWDLQQCNGPDDTWNRFQTRQTYCMPQMQISPTRISTPVLTSQTTDGISTLCRVIPQHPERNHQVMANAPTLHGVVGFLMSPISTGRKTVWAGTLRQCKHWIQTSSHRYTGIPFTLWLVFSDDVAVFRCAWRSREEYCDGKAWCWGIVFRCEEIDECYPDYCGRGSTGCGAPDDSDCNAMDKLLDVRIETRQWKTTRQDTKGECTRHRSWVDWGRASTSADPGGEVHFAGCLWSMEGSLMAASMFLVSFGWHQGSQGCVWTMAQWMATRYLGGISDFPKAEWDIFANACQGTCRVSRTWPRLPMKRDVPSRREKRKCTAQCTSSTKGSAFLSSSWPCSAFEVVANEVCCR